MGRWLLIVGVLVTSGCATSLMYVGAYSTDYDHAKSTFQRCPSAYYLAGLAIDAIIIGSDVAIGDEWNLYDGFVVVPVGLDAVIATAAMVDCVRDPW